MTDQSPALTLLHLSDLHFGQARGEATARFDQQLVTQALLADIRRQLELGLQPDAVLITGDIAFSGRPEEYQQAEVWLQQLCQATGLSSAQLLMVPGNHDVDRGLALKPLNRMTLHTGLRANPLSLNDY